jgi:hypothetical protein
VPEPGGVPAPLIASAISSTHMGQAELSTAEKAVAKDDSSSEGAEASTAQAPLAGKPASLPLGDRLEISAGTDGLFAFSSTSTQVSMFAEARYRLSSPLQLGVSLTYRYQEMAGVTSTAFQGLVGPVFNFGLFGIGSARAGVDDGGIENSFFFSPKAGLSTGQTRFNEVVVGSSTEPTFSLNAGKRFAINHWVAYVPSVGVVKELHFSPNFTVQPLSLSVFF